MGSETYGTIYALSCTCHDEGPRYVGQTQHPIASRLRRHFSAANRAVSMGHRITHSQAWILKHGTANIQIAALAFASDQEQLDIQERQWIADLPNLTNHLAGGKGEVAPGGKVTETQVHEIRALCDRFVPQEVVARRYGITADSVSNIARRRTWKHVAEAEPPLDPDAWIDSILVQLT